MNKETLSGKEYWDIETQRWIVLSKDVKQFIKEVEEDLDFIKDINPTIHAKINAVIKQRAGEKLIENEK